MRYIIVTFKCLMYVRFDYSLKNNKITLNHCLKLSFAYNRKKHTANSLFCSKRNKTTDLEPDNLIFILPENSDPHISVLTTLCTTLMPISCI